MTVLRMEIETEQPVLATQLLGDPNSSVSLDYLPGSLIRGAVIGALRANQRAGQPLDPANPGQARWFNGQVRFLNAYPSIDGVRMLPQPLSYLRAKQGGQLRFDAAGAAINVANLAQQHGPLAPARDGFVHLADNGMRSQRPLRDVNLHVQRDRQLGRATSDGGAVFSYDALASGQTFIAYVLCDDDGHANELLGLGLSRLWLGRSRSAGYGRVRIDLRRSADAVEDPAAADADGIESGDWAVLTLLSDALLHDEHGEPAACWSPGVLERLLGIPVTMCEERSWSALRTHGGHNATWQLPTPQHAALVAGSRVVFQPAQPLPAARLVRLRWCGVGARTIDGYGRISIGNADNLNLQVNLVDQGVALPHQAAAGDWTYADQMALDVWLGGWFEHAIEQKLRSAVRLWAGGANHIPPRSQLARVRMALRHAATAPGALVSLRDEIDGYASTAREYLRTCRVQGQELGTALLNLCADPAIIWGHLGIGEHDMPITAADVPLAEWARVRGRLFGAARAAEVARQFIDALMAGLAKQRRA